jgi:L-ascorbate metabolism protein UlaG (beta-lactamase superfamily)
MAELPPLDLALLPISGWGPRLPAGHLDPRRAAEALRLLEPRVVVPIHWGTYSSAFIRRQKRADFDQARVDEFRGLAAELAPAVDVRVLAPGEALMLEPIGR